MPYDPNTSAKMHTLSLKDTRIPGVSIGSKRANRSAHIVLCNTTWHVLFNSLL